MRLRAKYGIHAPRVVGAYIVTGVLLVSPALKDLACNAMKRLARPEEIATAVLFLA